MRHPGSDKPVVCQTAVREQLAVGVFNFAHNFNVAHSTAVTFRTRAHTQETRKETTTT